MIINKKDIQERVDALFWMQSIALINSNVNVVLKRVGLEKIKTEHKQTLKIVLA